jgi:hypothetical protein
VTGLARFELEGLGEVSLVMARLDTGRTHQIRVHLAQEGTPIVGDDKYGDFGLNRRFAKRGLRRMYLHAWRLEVSHPDGSGRMRVQVDPAPDFQAIGLAGSPPLKWASLASMADRGQARADERVCPKSGRLRLGRHPGGLHPSHRHCHAKCGS